MSAPRDALENVMQAVETLEWDTDHWETKLNLDASLFVSVDDIRTLYHTKQPLYVIPPQDYNRIELFTLDHYLMESATDANPLGSFRACARDNSVRSGSGDEQWYKVSGNEIRLLQMYTQVLQTYVRSYAKGNTHTK